MVAGVAGASAMILPGVSGGYLLLVLGVYVPILAGIDADLIEERDVSALGRLVELSAVGPPAGARVTGGPDR